MSITSWTNEFEMSPYWPVAGLVFSWPSLILKHFIQLFNSKNDVIKLSYIMPVLTYELYFDN